MVLRLFPKQHLPVLIPLIRIKNNPKYWRFWNPYQYPFSAVAYNYFDLTKKQLGIFRGASLRKALKIQSDVIFVQVGITRDDILYIYPLQHYLRNAVLMGAHIIVQPDFSIYLDDRPSWRLGQILKNHEKQQQCIEYLRKLGVNPHNTFVPIVIGTNRKEVEKSFRLATSEGFGVLAFNAGFWLRIGYMKNIYAFLNLCEDYEIVPVILNAGFRSLYKISSRYGSVIHITHFFVWEGIRQGIDSPCIIRELLERAIKKMRQFYQPVISDYHGGR